MNIAYISNYYKLLLYVSIGGYAPVSQALHDSSDENQFQLNFSYEEIRINNDDNSLRSIIEANKPFYEIGGSDIDNNISIHLQNELDKSSEGMSVPNLSKKEIIIKKLSQQKENRWKGKTMNENGKYLDNEDYLNNDILASSNNDALKNFVALILKKAESYGKIIGEKLEAKLNKGVNQGFGRYDHCIKKGSFKYQKMSKRYGRITFDQYQILRKERVLRSIFLDNKEAEDILKEAICSEFRHGRCVYFTAEYIKKEQNPIIGYILIAFLGACILMIIFVDKEKDEEEVYL